MELTIELQDIKFIKEVNNVAILNKAGHKIDNKIKNGVWCATVETTTKEGTFYTDFYVFKNLESAVKLFDWCEYRALQTADGKKPIAQTIGNNHISLYGFNEVDSMIRIYLSDKKIM